MRVSGRLAGLGGQLAWLGGLLVALYARRVALDVLLVRFESQPPSLFNAVGCGKALELLARAVEDIDVDFALYARHATVRRQLPV